MMAMLAARSARAHSKAGRRKACARLLHEARTALDRGPRPDDPDVLYWVTHGEIEMIAGSSALDLGDPAQAIRCFGAAIQADYQGDDQYPRSHAIYLARAAEAHLALHDLDAALERAAHAVRCLGGVDSARSASTVKNLRTRLAPHAVSPLVREFLDATRQRPLPLPQAQHLPQPGGGLLLIQRVNDRHPHQASRDKVLFSIVRERARLSRHTQQVKRDLEDRRIGLADAMLVRQHRHVEVPSKIEGGVRVMWLPAERVRQHRCPHARRPCLPRGLQHVIRRQHVRQQPPHQVVRRDAQQHPESLVPVTLADVAKLKTAVQLLAPRVSPRTQEAPWRYPLARLEQVEYFHHIGSQDPCEVQDQASKPTTHDP